MKKMFRPVFLGVIFSGVTVYAQTGWNGSTTNCEILPASSPYGEARAIRNIAYAEPSTARQNFDLYLPMGKDGQKFPVVVWIHGGAWMMGSKEWDNVKYLVRHGYAIASVDYRVSTETNFPAQIQDCNAALNFILSHAADYNLDTNKLVIGGASAGGHLALLLGMARQEKQFGANPAVKPLCILDFFGPTGLDQQLEDMQSICSQKGMETIRDAGSKLLGGPLENEVAKARWASPITYASTANPPVLILQGGKDDLVPVAQSQRLHAALDHEGIKNQLIVLPDVGHDGPLFSIPEVETKVLGFLNGLAKEGGK